jgi:hypothetical protein
MMTQITATVHSDTNSVAGRDAVLRQVADWPRRRGFMAPGTAKRQATKTDRLSHKRYRSNSAAAAALRSGGRGFLGAPT